MKLPTKSWPLWFALNLSLVWLPFALFISLSAPESLAERSVRADSIGLPVYGLADQLLLIIPIVNAVAWLFLHNYPADAPLFPPVGNAGRPLLIELVFLLVLVVPVWIIGESVVELDWGFLVVGIIWLYLVICFRAIVIARLKGPGRERGVASAAGGESPVA